MRGTRRSTANNSCECAGADRKGRAVRVAQVPEQVHELSDRVPCPLLDPEQLRQLADRDEDRQSEHEPLHHRSRQELRHEAEPQQPRHDEQAAAEQDQRSRVRRVMGGIRRR